MLRRRDCASSGISLGFNARINLVGSLGDSPERRHNGSGGARVKSDGWAVIGQRRQICRLASIRLSHCRLGDGGVGVDDDIGGLGSGGVLVCRDGGIGGKGRSILDMSEAFCLSGSTHGNGGRDSDGEGDISHVGDRIPIIVRAYDEGPFSGGQLILVDATGSVSQV